MQPNLPEVEGLVVEVASKVETNAVSRIRIFCLHRLRRGKDDVGVLILEQIDDQRPHRTFKTTAVFFPEPLGIGKPSNQISQSPHGKTDQNGFVSQIKGVFETGRFLATAPDLQGEADKIAFGAGNQATV